jgi:hypothetical protein
MILRLVLSLALAWTGMADIYMLSYVLLNIYCLLTPSCVELFEERNHRRLGIGAEIPLRRLGFFVERQKVLVASRESCKLLWESVHPSIWQLKNA